MLQLSSSSLSVRGGSEHVGGVHAPPTSEPGFPTALQSDNLCVKLTRELVTGPAMRHLGAVHGRAVQVVSNKIRVESALGFSA